MSKKPAADLSGLVATKGSAAPVANMPSRTPAHAEDTAADLKLNELLRMAFDDYEKKHS